MKKKEVESKNKSFFVINSNFEYFSGMMYGGQLVWCSDVREAKPFNEISKFESLKRICKNEELIIDYVD